ncbi:Synaptotagmin-9 [Nymphon striatum]|nr:Synaptotagmin-9 [Nymphon striatum]
MTFETGALYREKYSTIASLRGNLQLDLYQNKGILFIYAKGKDESRRCGRLHLRLSYDFNKSDLIVHVIEAHNLLPTEGNKFNDPFVTVRLEPEIDRKNRQTEIRKNSTDPLFDEIFKFPIAYDDMKSADLILELFDYDRFSRNEIIGEVKVDLEEIDVTSELEVWNPQEILVSLSYLPSAERLTVVVLKAKNLPLHESVKDPDLYVKVMLMSGEGKTKKKKTSSRKGSTHPVWNEALNFSIAPESFPQCQLIVTIINQDKFGNGHSIGSCVFGINRKSREYLHWQEVLKNPRKSFAMWHPVSSVCETQNRL